MNLFFSPFSLSATGLQSSSLLGETHSGFMYINSRVAFHLHGSNAFLKGSVRCKSILIYCNITYESSKISYRDDRFNLWIFFIYRNLGEYPPCIIWITEALSWWEIRPTGLSKTVSNSSCIGNPSPKIPESKLIISASQVLRAVAPWRFEPQHSIVAKRSLALRVLNAFPKWISHHGRLMRDPHPYKKHRCKALASSWILASRT